MTTTQEPPYSACFRPDDYADLTLFADREAELKKLISILDSFMAPGARGEARILVRGHRGVGKSILTRAAIQHAIDTRGPLAVIVDAARAGHGPDAFLRRLAADLAREVIENVTDETLVACAELLKRFSETTKVTVRETQQWTHSLQLGASAKHSFLNKVQFEFGLTRATARSRIVEDSYERPVDEKMLRELIQEFITDCRKADQCVLLFLDNLDQVGYGEVEEDITRVSNLARHLLGMRDAVIVANLRSEFVSADLRKLYSLEMVVEGMSPEDLMQVAEARMKHALPERRAALERYGFRKLARQLTQWTDNAWGFLSWLMFFDYHSLDCSLDDQPGLRRALLVFSRLRYSLSPAELDQIAAPYHGNPARFLTATELGMDEEKRELLERAVRYGALVPDLLLSPDRYMLAPGLHFLAHRS